jgi:hypothetical protein
MANVLGRHCGARAKAREPGIHDTAAEYGSPAPAHSASKTRVKALVGRSPE